MARFGIVDSLTNLLGQIGTSKGKGSGTVYTLSNRTPQQLYTAYREAWLPAKIVDIPARDATRTWRTWGSEEATAEETRLGLQRRTLQALIAARLYGGAGLFLDTGTTTPQNPLSERETITRLVVLPRGDITWPEKPNHVLDPYPEIFRVNNRGVHTSRLALFHGIPPVAGDWGFGDSVLQRAWTAIINADSVPGAVAELIWEAKLDIYHIHNFMQNLSDPTYEQKLLKRFQLANTGKSLVNALILDKEEEYEQKQISFSDLGTLVLTMYQVAAGAADIPVTRLLGQSAAGLNSAGDNEVRDYYDTIRAMQTLQISSALSTLDRHIAAKAGTGVDYQWNSLWQNSPAEDATQLNNISSSFVNLANSEILPPGVLYDPVISMLDRLVPGLAEAAGKFAEEIGESDED